MTVKEFCKGYMNTDIKLREQYLKDNLKITSYIPFLKKDVLAQNIVNATAFKYENYIKEDGTTGRRRTDEIHLNSTAQILLFYRVLIDNYTNLKVETEGFYEEYDALNESGLLVLLTLSFKDHPSLIPSNEIAELKGMVQAKQNDVFTNYGNPQTYVSNQITKVTTIASTILKPVLDKLAVELENMDDDKINKLAMAFGKGLKRVK